MADWFKSSQAWKPFGVGGEQSTDHDLPFISRRSPFLCRNACVCTSQPLASSIGYDLLRQGANAADVAVAVAAALAVTEPCSTGLGGDMFALYYDSSTRKVTCINGSGKSPSSLTMDRVRQNFPAPDGGIDTAAFVVSALAVTVPGAAQGWHDLLEKHGSGNFTLSQLVEPAAVLAEEGFPVAPITSHHWKSGIAQIAKWFQGDQHSSELPLTIDGRNGPDPGDIMTNPDMARVLREMGRLGVQEGFYRGWVGRSIIDTLQKHGGCMTTDDLQNHESTFPDPIAVEYRRCKLWQVPPNGQGMAALIALSGLKHLEEHHIISPICKNDIETADFYHVMIEMMRLAFADVRRHVSDARSMNVTNEWMLDGERIGSRAERLFDPDKATIAGMPDGDCCTISFQVVDSNGNAISFVNSNFMGFGTGIVPTGCGFTLQNRGFGFTLQDGHPNALAPAKRPYHTIIPGMLTHVDTEELFASLSNMGGNMQPQGHFQLTVSLLAGNLDPQAAIDRPRFCIADGTCQGVVSLEEGVDASVVEDLKRRGHIILSNVSGHDRSIFGRAQIIKRDRRTGVLWAGSDGRADGCAMGF